MSFINKELSREKIKALVKKYYISDLWSDVDDYLVGKFYRCVYDSGDNALFSMIKSTFIDVVNGGGKVYPLNGVNGVGVLIWQDSAVRVNYYKDFMEAQREMIVVATRIIAPNELRGKDEEIIKLLGDAITTYLTANLPPANQNDKYIFRPTDITFTDKEDVWKL